LVGAVEVYLGGSVTLGGKSINPPDCNDTYPGAYECSPVVLKLEPAQGTAVWISSLSATSGSGSSLAQFAGVAIDSSGNLDVVGFINGMASNVSYTFNSANSSTTVTGVNSGANAVVVQYNSSTGVAQWANTPTSGSSDSAYKAVSVDASGNIYSAGYVDNGGSFGFGNGITATGPYSGGKNALLVEYNSSGAAQLAYTPTTAPNYSVFSGVALDASGNLYVSGYINGNSSFGFNSSVSTGVSAQGTNGGSVNSCLVKYGY
jgi:hypothetical protein